MQVVIAGRRFQMPGSDHYRPAISIEVADPSA